jgi:hypothetical protein
MFTWLYMDHLAQPPDWMIEEGIRRARLTADQFKDWDGKDQWRQDGIDLVYEGNIIPSRRNQRVEFPEFEAWVNDNITDQWIGPPLAATGPGIRVSVPPQGSGSTIAGPHCDNPESWGLMYLLDLGGDDVWTKFWREQGKPLNRYGAGPGNGIVCNNFDNLILLESVKFPVCRWILLDATILHSIHGITGPRANITVRVPVGSFQLRI